MIEKTVHPIHFEDYSGQEFERLAFAYILRTEEWDKIDWYGQLGSDRGRDIWGILSNRGWNSNVCYQCANHQKIAFKKAKDLMCQDSCRTKILRRDNYEVQFSIQGKSDP
ncbi:hypothetical protein GF340_01270 [Candidatus Peregrinibacteria bacterium]|nr:hypothetical protein [Candidatus Peregrinibacteria bacterium]